MIPSWLRFEHGTHLTQKLEFSTHDTTAKERGPVTEQAAAYGLEFGGQNSKVMVEGQV